MQLIPKSMDISPVEHNIFESTDPHGPLRKKDLSKEKTKFIATAICNTIYHANGGVRVHALPFPLKRVFEAIVNTRRKSIQPKKNLGDYFQGSRLFILPYYKFQLNRLYPN